MAQRTRAQILAAIDTVRNEVARGANTRERIANLLADIADSSATPADVSSAVESGISTTISRAPSECSIVDIGSQNPVVLYAATPNSNPGSNGYLTAIPSITGRVNFEVTHTPTGATGAGYVWYQDASNFCSISATGLVTIVSVGVTCSALISCTWAGGQQLTMRVTFGGSLDTIIEYRIANGAWQLVGVGMPIPSPADSLRTPYVARSWVGVLNSISVTNARPTALYLTKPLKENIQGTNSEGRVSQAYWECETSSSRVALLARIDFIDQSTACGVRVNGTHTVSSSSSSTGPTLANVTGLSGTNRIRLTDGAKQSWAGSAPNYGAHGGEAVAVYTDSPAFVVKPPVSRPQVTYFMGDSIIAGIGSSNATAISKLARIRYASTGEVIVHGIGGLGGTHTNGSAYIIAAAMAEAMNRSKTQKFWLALGVNDYLSYNVTAANFGAWLLNIVVAIRALAPNAIGYLQSPIPCGTETANGAGSTLDDFRYETAVIANTRSTWLRYVHGRELTGATDGLHETDAGQATNAQIILDILAGAPPNMAAILGASLLGDWVGDNMTLNGSNEVTAWQAQGNGQVLASMATTHFATAVDANGRRYLTNASTDGRRLLNQTLAANTSEVVAVAKYSGPLPAVHYACAAVCGGTRFLQTTIGSSAWLSATGRKNGAASSVGVDNELAVWFGDAAAAPTGPSLCVGNDQIEYNDQRTWVGDIYSVVGSSAKLTAYQRMFVSASKRGFYRF